MNGTDYTHVRKLIAGSVDLVGLGTLNLRVPGGNRRRHIYAAVVWQGWLDWSAEGVLEMVSGGGSLETWRMRWGTSYDGSAGSTASSWDGADNGTGWRRISTGWPGCRVSTHHPANYPNGLPEDLGSDCVMFRTINRPDGVNPEAASVVMHPMLYVGNIEQVRFSFVQRSVLAIDAQPTVEVYLGCKTFTT